MNFTSTQKSYGMLHIAVLLFGFTAILGVLITLNALQIVWWRVLFTFLSLVVFLRNRHSLKLLSKRQIFIFLGIGAIVALHWLCFYGAIKLSNASITLVCMATASFFTALIEPLVHRTPWNRADLMIGVLIIPAMALIVGGLEASAWMGVVVGLLSAALAALFSSLNKKYVEGVSSISMTFLEMLGAWLFLSMILPFTDAGDLSWPSQEDLFWLIILSLLCTTTAFILVLLALRHITAFASNLVVNLEPVYGVLFAAVILGEHEQLTPMFYVGCAIILMVVLWYPRYIRRLRERVN